MDKNEILEKSRNENQNADPYFMEVNSKALTNGMLCALMFGIILTAVKLFKEQSLDFGLLAILGVFNAVTNIYKAVKIKEKNYVIAAVSFGIAAFIWTGLAVAQILTR